VNVLEHLTDPSMSIANLGDALRPGGLLLIHAPAHSRLFSAADEALGHKRRFDEDSIQRAVTDAGLQVVGHRQFNRLGAIGWRFNQIRGRERIGPWQATLFGLLNPVARLLEMVRFLPGLSWVVVARKP
jgi:hypothetical protein